MAQQREALELRKGMKVGFVVLALGLSLSLDAYLHGIYWHDQCVAENYPLPCVYNERGDFGDAILIILGVIIGFAGSVILLISIPRDIPCESGKQEEGRRRGGIEKLIVVPQKGRS